MNLDNIADFWSYRYTEALAGRLDVTEAVTFIPRDAKRNEISKQVAGTLCSWVSTLGGFETDAVLVDLGCGAGRMLQYFCDAMNERVEGGGASIIGVEPDAHARILARQCCPGASILRGTTYDFPPRSVNPTHVFMSGVLLYHTDEEIRDFIGRLSMMDQGVIFILKEPVLPPGSVVPTYDEIDHRERSLGRIHYATYRTGKYLWDLLDSCMSRSVGTASNVFRELPEFSLNERCWTAKAFILERNAPRGSSPAN